MPKGKPRHAHPELYGTKVIPRPALRLVETPANQDATDDIDRLRRDNMASLETENLTLRSEIALLKRRAEFYERLLDMHAKQFGDLVRLPE